MFGNLIKEINHCLFFINYLIVCLDKNIILKLVELINLFLGIFVNYIFFV